ncbi:helix-turn-helix transcriptional regulator [Pseudokineococcus basanitobsidens]|uniref:Helix-turn-helix transcriptional regulator n=1 Tax=Pseudokineococcus basanitobsidens TaxID=1926649 RepID=A0ABU8RJ06_9ACTN
MADNSAEVRQFLTTRRARVSPEQVGLPQVGHRRVPGLRRGEVATLAGVSIEYYTRLERGNLKSASDEVLEALAGALQLDEAERSHLADLARAARTRPSVRRTPSAGDGEALRPGVHRLLEAMTGSPAFVRNGRLDVLAMNRLGRALYAPMLLDPPGPSNMARFNFLDPRSRDLYPDWDVAADTAVALLRTEAGRAPFDRGLADLVGELSVRSEAFRTRWSAHDVRLHRTGTKSFQHPQVGRLELDFEAMELASPSRLVLTAYTAAAGTPSGDALELLAVLAATTDATTPAADPAGARTTRGTAADATHRASHPADEHRPHR